MATTEVPGVDADTQRLNELGYAQELKRGLGTFSNFAISFCVRTARAQTPSVPAEIKTARVNGCRRRHYHRYGHDLIAHYAEIRLR